MRNKIKIGVVFSTLILLGINTNAQQEIQNSFYMFNGSVLNPAYAGSRDALSAVANYRNQWSGWKGAPVSTMFTIHTPLVNESIGIGLNAVNDQIGPTNKSAVFGDFAYRLKLNSKNDRLCFGIRAGADLIRNNFNGLKINDAADPLTNGNTGNTNFNTNAFNVGAGVYYYGKKHFVGVTVPKMLANKLSKDPLFAQSTQELHAYLITGFVAKLNSLWDLKPGAAVKFTPNAPISIDGNLSVLYNKMIWFGLLYRHNAAVGANIVYNVTPQFHIGYAYDFAITNMGQYNPSSHEIMLGFDFIRKSKALKSPRYF